MLGAQASNNSGSKKTQSRTDSGSGLGLLIVRVRGEFAEQELLHHGASRASCQSNRSVRKGESHAISVRGWIVKVRKAARCQVAQHVGIVGLPVSVVALADDGIGQGIKEP